MNENNKKKISSTLLKMLDKEQKKPDSLTKIIQENKIIIEKLKSKNYSYTDIAKELTENGIKITPRQIGRAIKGKEKKKKLNINTKKTTKIKKEPATPRHVTTYNDDNIFKKSSPEDIK